MARNIELATTPTVADATANDHISPCDTKWGEIVADATLLNDYFPRKFLSSFARDSCADFLFVPTNGNKSPKIPVIHNEYTVTSCNYEADYHEILFHMVPVGDLEAIVKKIDPLIKDNEIHASLNDLFPRPFGRDAHITAKGKFASFDVFPRKEDEEERVKVSQAVIGMYRFLANRDYPMAGIEKGKHAHEVGTESQGYPKTFYNNEDGFGENYDSIDATDWAILTASDVVSTYPTKEDSILPYVEQMTEWAIRNVEEFGGPAYVGADYDPRRYYRGLHDQRWRDGYRTTVKANHEIPAHPMYPVFESSLRWSALRHSAQMLEKHNPNLSRKANITAAYVKEWFNDHFLYEDEQGIYLADALDGFNNKITPVTIDCLLALLPSIRNESIIDDPFIRRSIIRRAQHALFDPRGGLYTVSKMSIVHPENVYQNNKTIWLDTVGMAVKLLEEEAGRVEQIDPQLAEEYRDYALLNARAMAGGLLYWGSPVEMFQITQNGKLTYFYHTNGDETTHQACKVQAWTGAWGEYVYRYLLSRGVTRVPVPC